MKTKSSLLCISSILIFFLSINGHSQDLYEPQMNAVPPPPGLVVPIDANISLLAAAGVLLGVFYYKGKK